MSVATTTRTNITKADDALRQWQGTATKLEADAQRLLDTAGEKVAADEATPEEIAEQVDALRRQAAIAREAIPAAEKATRAARADALLDEALRIDAEADQAQAGVDERRQVTLDLLAKLREHEGIDYAPAPLVSGDRRWTPTADTDRAQADVNQLRLQAKIARAVAAGQRPIGVDHLGDPIEGIGHHQLMPEDYPACVWGPDAIVRIGG